jgi:hypothetical protein
MKLTDEEILKVAGTNFLNQQCLVSEEEYGYVIDIDELIAFAHAIADLQREEICSIADHLAYNEYRTPSEVHVLEELTAKIRANKGEGK